MCGQRKIVRGEMSDQLSLHNIDSLLLQLVLQTHELSNKKNEVNQQIKVCRADIGERKSYIESIHTNIKTLEEEIRVKQSTVQHNKTNAKSMKATKSLLLQYEQSLKAELESTRAHYNHDMEVYEGNIANYKKIFQAHEEYYYQNPLAQKLIKLQAENNEIESRIKACDDQLTMKHTELDYITDPAVKSSSSENLPDGVSGRQATTEPEEELAEDDHDSTIGIASLFLNQTKEASPAVSEAVEAAEKEMEESVASEEEQPPGEEENEGLAPHCESPTQGSYPQSSPATMTAASSTPTLQFNFSPGSSPHQETSYAKSPAFPFLLNSNPSTPGFSGFGFDMDPSQDEDPSFLFTSPFFNEKKAMESKSDGPDFLFNQPNQSEDFQFAFAPKSPQTTSKENTKNDLPFSFNF